MIEKNRGNRSVRLAGFAGGVLIVAGVFFLRFEQRIHAKGTVHALEENHVYAPADGTLAQLAVSLGKDIRAGDTIAVLDNPDLRARSLQLEKDLAEMRAQLAQNGVALLATNVLPELEKEKLVLDRDRLQKKILLAGDELQLATNLLASMLVVSPMDGRIVALGYRYPGMSVPRGALLAKVAVMDGHYRVRALAGEKNIDLVKPGTDVFMKSGVFNSMLEGYVRGKVFRISPEAEIPSAMPAPPTQYEIYVDVAETPYPLALGSTMDLELRLGKRPMWGMLFDTHHRRTNP